MSDIYIYNDARRIWQRPSGPAISYSDGDEAENYLLHTLKNAKDVSSTSPELAAAIRDWPSEYHLSLARHNLLRFLEVGPEHRVLELGCGCGAITRFLGETGASVIAVEGSPRRAEIAAERCRDLANVSIYCDNIADFICAEKFDYITLIGVLEYAPRFVAGDDPVRIVLDRARSLLKTDGVLILAIENQLGLKYFNGCREDHVGEPFYGVHGLYGRNDPVTFGRRVITEKLRQAGYAGLRFYYPFPDYKLPQIVLTDAAYSCPDFDAASLLAGFTGDDRPAKNNSTFFEPLAWRTIIANGLLPELANSFLILAGIREDFQSSADPTVLAWAYSPKRLPRYATETIFRREQDGRIVVEKHALHPSDEKAAPLLGGILHHCPATSTEHLPGRLYSTELQVVLARGEDTSAVAAWATDWLELLLAHASNDNGKWLLPGDWLDAIPQNFVRVAAGTLRRIDIEWRWSRPVPLAWIVIRGLVNAIVTSPASASFADMSLRKTIRQIAASMDISLEEEDFRQVSTFEAALREVVFGDRGFKRTFEQLLNQPARKLSKPSERELLAQQIALLEKEIARVKSTVSWQVTKPLRLIANLPRHLRQWFSREREIG
jgi:SAM-dependent methyltransferase